MSFEVDAVRVCRDGGFLVASDAEAGPRKAFTKTFEVTIYALLVLPWVREIHIYICMCMDAYCVQNIET